MADSSPDSSDKSELVGLKHISTSLFSIPGFFVGFGAKGTSEPDAGKSPTSPLDFGVFANFGGLFSPKSPACSSPRNSQRNKWSCDKVGLSILNSLANDTGQGNVVHSDSFRIVLAPRIKIDIHKTSKLSGESLDPSVKSNSFPKNYADLHSQLSDSNTVFGNKRVPKKCKSPTKSSSSPMNIISSQLYSRSLSAREMTLSEDYTCIISHGPNPKTTHIFGDCVLDCDPKELTDFDAEEELGNLEEDPLPNPPGDSSSRVCSCKKEAQDGQSIHIHRFGIETGERSAEDVHYDSLVVSPGSSYHEDVFPMGMPINSEEASFTLQDQWRT